MKRKMALPLAAAFSLAIASCERTREPPPPVYDNPAPEVLSESVLSTGAPRLNRVGLTPTFNDDFTSFSWDEAFYNAGPKTGTWRTSYANGEDPYNVNNRSLPGNKEMEYYSDLTAPNDGPAFGVHPFEILPEGVLRITANPMPKAFRDRAHGLQYTSGMINTYNSFAQKYGVFEMRAKLPAGKGLWPAFWTLNKTGGWPPEIDIFEIIGQEPSHVFTAVHSAEKGKRNGEGMTTEVSDTNEAFHTYAVDWGPKETVFYFDEAEIWRYPTPADLHEPMYLIVNLAVGGKWPGAPDKKTVFPAHFDIDWVRVWQRKEYAQ